MAGIALTDLDHGSGEDKTKKSKKKNDDQPQTAGQQVKGFAKQLLSNVVGKQPGGAVDPGNAMLAMQSAVYSKDGNPLPQYNAKSQVADLQNHIRTTQQSIAPGTPWESAGPRYQADLDKYRFLDPQGADRMTKELQEQHPKTPPVQTPAPPGTPEYTRTHLDEVQKQIQQFMGRPMTDEESSEFALGQFGVHPTQKITNGPRSKGSDLNFDLDDQGNPRDPQKTYMERRMGSQITYHPVATTQRAELKHGNDMMGSLAPPGTLDAFGRPLTKNQLYTVFVDDSGKPKSYVPKAMENEYKVFTDEDGKPYAIPVERYQSGGGGTPPGPVTLQT